MDLILKRGTEYTPIAFLNSTIQNKKYCKLVEGERFRCTTNQLMDINLSTVTLEYRRESASRQQIYPFMFPGGIFINIQNPKLLVLTVYKDNPDNRFVIVNKDIDLIGTSYLAKVKKSMNDQDISSRTKLLLWNNNEIHNQFVENLTPNMEDYSTEVQERLSKEFIESQRLIIGDIEIVDKKEFFEVGDFVIVIGKQWGGFELNSFCEITKIESRNDRVTMKKLDNSITCYHRLSTDIRFATEEEIKTHLNSTTETVTNVEFEEDDYVIILSNRNGGNFPIDSVAQIMTIDYDSPLQYRLESINSSENWWYRGEDIRLATDSEIEDYNNPIEEEEFIEEHIDEILEEVEETPGETLEVNENGEEIR
jgi:hypothetical protein